MRAQSAVEYLMTYGWSILIVAVVIASLILLGVFNSGNTGTSSCLATPGFNCTNPTLYSSGSLVTKIGQVSTQAITITGTACTKNNTVTAITPLSKNATLQSEGSQQMVFFCPISSSATGTQFTGHLWIEYSTPSQQNIIQEVGAVVTPVVSSNTFAYSPIAYVVNYLGGFSYVGNTIEINLNTGQITGAIPSDGTSGAFHYPTEITISGSTVYVVNENGGSGTGNILEFNLNTGQITGAIPSDGTSGAFQYPTGITISGSTAYVVNSEGGSGNGNLIEINLNTGQITGAIPSDGTSGAFYNPVEIAITQPS